MQQYILSLDQGTTSSRAILFNRQGEIAGTASHEFAQIYPHSGWVEHNPFDILTSQLGTAVEVMGKTGVRPRDIAALGIKHLQIAKQEDGIFMPATRIMMVIVNRSVGGGCKYRLV